VTERTAARRDAKQIGEEYHQLSEKPLLHSGTAWDTREGTMTVRDRSYLDGFGTVRNILEWDELTLREIVESLDPDQDADAQLTPWKRGYRAAIRAAFGA
jgi:hypothetical protein